jgi:type IX secretion system PorP/SprF family membrane protein
MIPKSKFLTLLLFATVELAAQDPQLSQYYNAPLFLNPALTGTANNSRGVINYRTQWTSLPTPYRTFAASFDHNIEPYNSGVGLLIKNDRQGDGGLTSTDVNLIYSYHVYINENLNFVPAIQAGFVTRDVSFFNLVFGDQLDNNGVVTGPTSDNFSKGSRVSYLDFSTGGILYSDAFWFGVSAHHLNEPVQSFTDNTTLPMRMSLHGGYKFFLEKPIQGNMYSYAGREKSIIPTFMYKMQGKYDQFDLGVYAIYEPVMFGLWYRGIPIKKYEQGLNNHESLIFLAGLHYQGISFGYSYDLTISSFKPGSGGSHEISLIYEWEIPYNMKKKKRARKVSCPKF